MYNRNTFNITCIQEIIEREFLISNANLRSTSVITYDNVVQSGSSNKVIYYIVTCNPIVISLIASKIL